MPKDYTADKVTDLLLKIKFSTPDEPVVEAGRYYAAVQKIKCYAKNHDMKVRVTTEDKYYGTAKSVPWTAKEVGDAMKNFNNLNTAIYNDLKAIYLDAINEDIT